MERSGLLRLFDSRRYLEYIGNVNHCTHPDDLSMLARSLYHVGEFHECYQLLKKMQERKFTYSSSKLDNIFIEDLEKLRFNVIFWKDWDVMCSSEDENGYYPECYEALSILQLGDAVSLKFQELIKVMNDFKEDFDNHLREEGTKAAFTLGRISFEHNDFVVAEKYLEFAALNTGLQQPVYFGLYASCLYKNNKLLFAERMLAQAIELDKYNPRWYYLKAQLLRALSEKEGSLFCHKDTAENALRYCQKASSLCNEENSKLLNEIKALMYVLLELRDEILI